MEPRTSDSPQDKGGEAPLVIWDRAAFQIAFLGTCSGIPTRHRNMSSIALSIPQCSSKAASAVLMEPPSASQHLCFWLVDCGGGTQQQLLKLNIWIGHIHRLFITHLHGDHCYDTVGLLALRSMRQIKTPFQLVGPKGIREWVDTTMKVSQLYLGYPLEIVELPSGEEVEINSFDSDIGRGWRVRACPIEHRIDCVGYVFDESPPRGAFDAAKAIKDFSVPKADLRFLAQGKSLTLKNGTIVTPEQCSSDRRPASRKIVVLGDTHDPSRIGQLATGCDVIVHEATFATGEEDKAVSCGHSTPSMALQNAAAFGANNLILTHFSARYCEPHAEITVEDLLASAKKEALVVAPKISIFAASDFWSYKVAPHVAPKS